MSREDVLGRIRRSLAADRRNDATRRSAAEQWIREPIRHPIPACALQTREALCIRIRSELSRQAADVVTIETESEAPSAVAAYLKGRSVPPRLRIGHDPMLAKLPWGAVPDLTVDRGAASPSDMAGLSRALCGVAETGTLVLASSAENPATLAFLPETHIIVLDSQAIVGPLEDAFDRVRSTFGAGAMPRSLNLISGPSRTGDIGGRIVLGAHGPRRLAVILVGA